jgi:phosphatidate cytidylyltransferase
MFWQRTLSAALLIAIVLSGFIYGNVFLRMIPIVFLIVVAFLGVTEAARLLEKIGMPVHRGLVFAATACLCASTALGCLEHLPLILAISLWGAIGIEMSRYRENSPGSVIHSIGGTLFVLLWVGLPLAMALDLYVSRDLFSMEGVEGRRWLKLLLAVTWATDSFAYITGKTFRGLGKIHPLSRLSPKKTWEGAIGGLVGGGVLIPIILSLIVPRAYPADRLLTELIPVACGLSILGQIGDLGESLVKRQAGEKDSGITHTGHGGVLDIIDSLLLAAAGLWCYVWLTQPSLLV